jgi:aminoglycoside phosphotransferase (APT) family kinase protein
LTRTVLAGTIKRMPFPSLNTNDALAALSQLGINLNASEITVERHEDRWLVRLPDERLAWFAASETGRNTLIADRRVLRLVESRCAFHAPRILAEHRSGDFDVRAMVPGASDPVALYNAACSNLEIAKQIGIRIGQMLAELHTRTQRPDVESFLPHKPSWPDPGRWIRERLPAVIDDRKLVAKIDEVLSHYECVQVAEEDRVLIHADLGMHALAYDPRTFRINGLFDFEGAAYADRHHDFQYLILGNGNTNILDEAIATYEPVVGRAIHRDRVHLYNAACASSYLAFRIGHEPDEPWCGRTLAEDLEWTRSAIESADSFMRA